MEPVAVAAPMTFTSPHFVLLVLTIVGVVVIAYVAFTTVAKSSADTAPYDSARTLINTALIMLALVFLYVAGIVAYQVFVSNNGSATTEAWGQLCLFIGWVLGTATTIYNTRFGTTKASAEKDAALAQMARTGAALQDSFLDPKVVVTGTGSGQAKATLADPAAPGAPAAGAPIQTENLTVTSLNTTVTEGDPKDK